MARRVSAIVAVIAALTLSAAATVLVGTALATPHAASVGASLVTAHDVVAPAPVAAPQATARPTHKPKPKPRVHHVAPKPVRAGRAPSRAPRRHVATLTPQQLMMRAVNRIPGYHTGEAVFVITPGLGNWGLAAMGGGVVYISPKVPSRRMYDVVAHEWSHLLSAKVYGNDVSAALAAMNEYFGGSGLTGAERAADCMARLLGATWTHYTPCTNAHWRAGAKRLLSRQQL